MKGKEDGKGEEKLKGGREEGLKNALGAEAQKS